MTIRVHFDEDNAFEDGHEIYVRDTEMTWDTDLPTPDTAGPDVDYVDLDYDETQAWYVIVAAVKGSTKVPSEQVFYNPNWTPAELFTSGQQGVWYDISDISTLWQDDAGTTPVSADGDPVGRVDDKSGNGNHVTQSVSASRPTYRTDGTLHWLEFDGVDDYLTIPSTKSLFSFFHNGAGFYSGYAFHNTGSGDLGTIYATEDPSTGNIGVFVGPDNRSGDGSFILITKGVAGDEVYDGSNANDGTSLDTNFVFSFKYKNNGLSDDGQVYRDGASLRQGGTVNSPVTGDSQADFHVGNSPNGNWVFAGRIYQMVVVDNYTADRVATEDYLATKAGVTL